MEIPDNRFLPQEGHQSRAQRITTATVPGLCEELDHKMKSEPEPARTGDVDAVHTDPPDATAGRPSGVNEIHDLAA